MRVHLIRHGHTDALGRTLTGRSPNVGLNAQGREAAARTARSLARDTAIARVFSSPQLRARQTAEPIAAGTGCVVVEEAALDEVDFGAWAGLGFAELQHAPGWAEWNALRSLAATPGGETMLQVQARAIGFVQGLSAAWPEASVVLVSHADVIRSMLAHLLGQPIDMMQRLEIFPASRSIVVLSGTDVRVEAVNLPPGA